MDDTTNRPADVGRDDLAAQGATDTQSRPDDELERGSEPEGGLPAEKVEDRPSVGTVKPEDYPMDRPDR